MSHAAFNRHAEMRDVGEFHGVVGLSEDRFGEVEADFAGVDIERGNEVEVGDGIAAKHRMHDPRDFVAILRALIMSDALDERGGAVADANDGNVDLSSGTTDAGCVV